MTDDRDDAPPVDPDGSRTKRVQEYLRQYLHARMRGWTPPAEGEDANEEEPDDGR